MDELDSLEREEYISCDKEVVRRKVEHAKGNMLNMVCVLHQDTFASYTGIQQSVDQWILAV